MKTEESKFLGMAYKLNVFRPISAANVGGELGIEIGMSLDIVRDLAARGDTEINVTAPGKECVFTLTVEGVAKVRGCVSRSDSSAFLRTAYRLNVFRSISTAEVGEKLEIKQPGRYLRIAKALDTEGYIEFNATEAKKCTFEFTDKGIAKVYECVSIDDLRDLFVFP